MTRVAVTTLRFTGQREIQLWNTFVEEQIHAGLKTWRNQRNILFNPLSFISFQFSSFIASPISQLFAPLFPNLLQRFSFHYSNLSWHPLLHPPLGSVSIPCMSTCVGKPVRQFPQQVWPLFLHGAKSNSTSTSLGLTNWKFWYIFCKGA